MHNCIIMKVKVWFVIAVVLLSGECFAQNSRTKIKQQIQQWGCCRNVAITLTAGNVALNWTNAYVCEGCPAGLVKALDELNEKGEFIDDVQLTEAGNWLVLYGDNGFRWNNIPYSLEQKLREFNDRGEVVTSVSFNDIGDWVVISKEHISASSQEASAWVAAGTERYGQAWSVHMTDDGMVVCYEDGYKVLGNVPQTVIDALANTNLDFCRVKFLPDGAYFIVDVSGYYEGYF